MDVYCLTLLVLLVVAKSLSAADYGLYNLVINSDKIACTLDKSLGLDVSKLKLYMYDLQNNVNNTYDLDSASSEILSSTGFDINRRTIIYVPGFINTPFSFPSQQVLQNLKHVPNAYVYIIDHSAYTSVRSLLVFVESYERAAEHYWDIGVAIANFLDDMVSGGVSIHDIDLLGHSLGAHMIGAAGEYYYDVTGDHLPRLTAMDPAGPCFTIAEKEHQVRSGLAEHVQVYHCDAGELGTSNDYGDVNYYANSGTNQPECPLPVKPDLLVSAIASVCSHLLCPSIVTFAVRQKNIYEAVQCDSYDNFTDGTCPTNLATLAGFDKNFNDTGIYYFNTTHVYNMYT